jgi:hypothetical protein
VGFLVGDAELIDCLIGDIVEQVEPRSTLLPFAGLKLVGKELVKPQNCAIGNNDIPEPVEFLTDRVGDSDLVDAPLDEVAQIFCQQWRQPLIEATGREGLVGSTVVASSESGECSALACGEAEHECPDESRNLEFAVPFDHAEFLGVLFKHRRWKERSEPTSNSS